MKKLQVGETAPLFVLKNQGEKEVSLKEFKGKKTVLLYFYPKAMTPGCTLQACGLRDVKKKFTALQTVALGVSPDSPARLQKFIEKEKLNFDLLSDEDHQTALSYGVWGLKKFMGKEYEGILRTTFIIGKDGKIAHIMDKVNTKSHHEETLALLHGME